MYISLTISAYQKKWKIGVLLLFKSKLFWKLSFDDHCFTKIRREFGKSLVERFWWVLVRVRFAGLRRISKPATIWNSWLLLKIVWRDRAAPKNSLASLGWSNEEREGIHVQLVHWRSFLPAQIFSSRSLIMYISCKDSFLKLCRTSYPCPSDKKGMRIVYEQHKIHETTAFESSLFRSLLSFCQFCLLPFSLK